MKVLALLALFAGLAIMRRPFSASDSERISIYKVALHAFTAHPVLGVGTDGFENAFRREKPFGPQVAANAHNDILQVAATMGLLGLAAYAFLVLSVFQSVTGPALGAMVALFVGAKFSPVPLEALVLGAVICAPVGKSHKGIAAPLVIVILALAAPIAYADYIARKGDFGSIVRACRINPYEPVYKIGLMRAGVYGINTNKSPELRAAILNAMHDESRSEVQHRPGAEATKDIENFSREVDRQTGIR